MDYDFCNTARDGLTNKKTYVCQSITLKQALRLPGEAERIGVRPIH